RLGPELSSREAALTGDAWVRGCARFPYTTLFRSKATFGFVAGPGGQPTRGHLTLQDQSTGQTIHGTVITSFTECVSGQSEFDGTIENGHGCQLDTGENREPGAARETFTISGAYSN